MSFFNSLQQYVTSGVAGLGLSPRKLSISRQGTPNSTTVSISGSPQESLMHLQHHQPLASNKQDATPVVHGLPKVIPASHVIAAASFSRNEKQTSIKRQSRQILGFLPPRQISVQQKKSPIKPISSECTRVFCKKKQSWPEVLNMSSSGIQESDGYFFENLAGLLQKLENLKLSFISTAKTRPEIIPKTTNCRVNNLETLQLKENSYADLLRIILNTIGASKEQLSHYKDDMFLYVQQVFDMTSDQHYKLLHAVAEEPPKITVLSVIVQEAEGLEAKDVNGFSDPYCMLGIQSGRLFVSPPSISTRDSFETGIKTLSLDLKEQDNQRHGHGFKVSFKHKDYKSDHRGSIEDVQIKNVQATSVKLHTLCPKWNEKFKFYPDSINSDILHLDIWDNDSELNVLEELSYLNEAHNVGGVGRLFKQICQSSRQSSQDDFLGSVNIQVRDIPSFGMDTWFKLEGHGHRGSLQARIRLKLWFSSLDIHDVSEQEDEDNTKKVLQLENLYRIFMMYELRNCETSWAWNGDLPRPAMTILHQVAMQNGISELHCALARFGAAIKINPYVPIHSKFIHKLLIDIDRLWINDTLVYGLGLWLAELMNVFIENSLSEIMQHRDIFPPFHHSSLTRLEFLLRSLGLLGSMRAFRQISPLSKGIRGEIVSQLKKGSLQWAQLQLHEAESSHNPILTFTTILAADLQLGLDHYHSLFDSTNGIQYFSIIYKQFDTVLTNEVTIRIRPCLSQWIASDFENGMSEASMFEVYFSIHLFSNYKQYLSAMPQPPEKPLGLDKFHLWFESVVHRWISISREKMLQRVKTAITLDHVSQEAFVHCSTSSIDIVSSFNNFRDFWHNLSWPDSDTSTAIETQMIEIVCEAATLYTDLIMKNLSDKGYFEQNGQFSLSDDLCININNVEHIRRGLSAFYIDDKTIKNSMSFESILTNTIVQLELKLERILSKIKMSMESSLHKFIFHLAWSPDSLPADQAIVPLLEYLDTNLSSLNNELFPKNFDRALNIVWLNVLNELSYQIDNGNDSERPRNFHERLHEAIHLLVDFFHAHGSGLGLDILKCESYIRIEQRLQYHRTDTESLIDIFYIRRLQEQCLTNQATNFGTLNVRAYFNHDSLCVEILSANDVIPLDPNGFSDPFVIIELLPRRIFTYCTEQQTNVCKKTLNPIFDECFEFSVTREECLHEAAMIIFTVMDHDVLTANDFAGEAFLGLNNVPGISEFTTSVENFHGLKHIELPLMQQKDKNNPILQILDSRIHDKNAVDFVKKQKVRMT